MKITWDGATRLGTVIEAPNVDGVIPINVATDVYSSAVVDWAANNASGLGLRRFYFPVTYTGGAIDPVTGDQQGAFFTLQAPWKIQMFDATHEMRMNGVLRTSDGSRFWLPPPTASGYAVIAEPPADVVAVITGTENELVAQGELNTALLRNTRIIDQTTVPGQPAWVVLTDDDTGELVRGRAWSDEAGTIPWDGLSPIVRVDRME